MQEIFENFVKKGWNQIFFVFSQRYRRDKKSPLRYTKGTTTIQIDEYNKITNHFLFNKSEFLSVVGRVGSLLQFYVQKIVFSSRASLKSWWVSW